MIQFANIDTTPLVRTLWKTCFEDTEEYLDLHFSKKYKPQNTLLYFEKDTVVAALQMLPYTIRFYGKEIPFYYLAGLCTLPEYRNKGYMGELIKASLDVMKRRRIPICGLVPADDWLFNYYRKYGFETVFDPSENTIDLKSFIEKDLSEAYIEFDKQYQQADFCVLKTKEDLDVILTDYKSEGCPPKGNLKGMARIILPEETLSLYASENNSCSLKIQIEQDIFDIKNGKVGKTDLSSSDISVNFNFLTRLLFGYETFILESPYNSLFEEHHPIINLMLE